MSKSKPRPFKLYPITLGCPKNRVDTEKLLALLAEQGVEIVLEPSSADVLFINTCAFIREAVEESIDHILELAEGKRPGQRLVVAGCLVARYREELLPELPEVDLFLGTEPFRRPELFWEEEKFVPRLEGPETTLRLLTASPFYAYLKVVEGCRHACSFCTIPRIRGPLRSLPQELLLEEAQRLLDQGVQEIILVGQDVSAYGLDQGQRKLAPLIRALLALPNLKWLRLLYLYPDGITEELIDLLAEGGKLCPYLDLPIQHASPSILAQMRRSYRPEDLLSLIKKLRARVPQIALRTSVIVGFPGETEKDFTLLLDFLQEAAFDHLGAFVFSPEEGTLAARLPGQLSEAEKRARWEEVMALQQEISRQRLLARLGEETEVLLEGEEGERFFGHARFQAPEVDGLTFLPRKEGVSVGDIVSVRLTQAQVYDLEGEILGYSSKKEGNGVAQDSSSK